MREKIVGSGNFLSYSVHQMSVLVTPNRNSPDGRKIISTNKDSRLPPPGQQPLTEGAGQGGIKRKRPRKRKKKKIDPPTVSAATLATNLSTVTTSTTATVSSSPQSSTINTSSSGGGNVPPTPLPSSPSAPSSLDLPLGCVPMEVFWSLSGRERKDYRVRIHAALGLSLIHI